MAEEKDLLNGIHKIIEKGKTADSSLEIIADLLQSLTMTIEGLIDTNKSGITSGDKIMKSYDSIGESVTRMSEAVSKLKPPVVNVTVDMDQLNRINGTMLQCLQQIESQQKIFTTALQKLAPEDRNEVQVLQSMLDQNSRMFESLATSIQQQHKETPVIQEHIEPPKEWTFEIERGGLNSRLISKIIATAK